MTSTDQDSALPSEDEFYALVAAANGGDTAALKRLRAMLDDHPEIYQRVGDMAAHAEAMLIDLIAGDSVLMAESLQRQLQSMRTELIGSDSTVLERMAAGRVMATWLQLQYADYRVAETPAERLPQAEYALKWQLQADRRYAAAVKSLGELRLVLPQIEAAKRRAARRPLRVFKGTSNGSERATGTS